MRITAEDRWAWNATQSTSKSVKNIKGVKNIKEEQFKMFMLRFFQLNHRYIAFESNSNFFKISCIPTFTLCLQTWNWSRAAWALFAYLAKQAHSNVCCVPCLDIQCTPELSYCIIYTILLSSAVSLVAFFSSFIIQLWFILALISWDLLIANERKS